MVSLARFPYLTSGRRSIHMKGMSVMFLKSLLVLLNLKKSSREITSDIPGIRIYQRCVPGWQLTSRSLTGMLPQSFWNRGGGYAEIH